MKKFLSLLILLFITITIMVPIAINAGKKAPITPTKAPTKNSESKEEETSPTNYVTPTRRTVQENEEARKLTFDHAYFNPEDNSVKIINLSETSAQTINDNENRKTTGNEHNGHTRINDQRDAYDIKIQNLTRALVLSKDSPDRARKQDSIRDHYYNHRGTCVPVEIEYTLNKKNKMSKKITRSSLLAKKVAKKVANTLRFNKNNKKNISKQPYNCNEKFNTNWYNNEDYDRDGNNGDFGSNQDPITA